MSISDTISPFRLLKTKQNKTKGQFLPHPDKFASRKVKKMKHLLSPNVMISFYSNME